MKDDYRVFKPYKQMAHNSQDRYKGLSTNCFEINNQSGTFISKHCVFICGDFIIVYMSDFVSGQSMLSYTDLTL